jgi:hypothetical protein
MLEDLQKIEDSWREMDEFAAFLKRLFTMTKSKQKQLKEDMSTLFLKKMVCQVQKHNKQYILRKHLIRSVLAKQETGQAVAQLLKGSNKTMVALGNPRS